jgi:ABC-type sugar transport system ATPase subunit
MDQGVLLEAANITKSYAGVHALRDASLELRAGEVHALVGENGAGKSTLIKVLTGAVIPDSGEISLDGAKIIENSPSISKSHGIAAIYQQPALFPELSVAENIAIGQEGSGTFFGMVNWARRKQRAKELPRSHRCPDRS